MLQDKIIIPKGKEPITTFELDSPRIIAPDGTGLSVYVPQTEEELINAWNILIDYTKRISPNPESALQDLDDIEDVISYHFSEWGSRKYGYTVFTVVDKDGEIRAVAPAEVASIHNIFKENEELVKPNGTKRKGAGFIYQIAHDKAISNNDNDFSVAKELYKCIANDILPTISKYKSNSWQGIVTESRKKGPELEAILKATFGVLVPNEYWQTPSLQRTEDEENLIATDLILLGNNISKDPELRKMLARAYFLYSYWDEKRPERKKCWKLLNTFDFSKVY